MSNQMPGPDASGFEDGLSQNGIGQDYRELAPRDPDTHNDQLPGGDGSEKGWVYGADLRGMADGHPMEIPQASNMGVLSDDGDMVGDVAQSAGFRIIGDLGSNTAGVQTGDIIRVFDAQEANSAGAREHTGSTMGMDSMRGIVLGAGSGPVVGPGNVMAADGEQDTGSSGDRGIGMFPQAPDQGGDGSHTNY